MKKQYLILHKTQEDCVRSVIKTKHGRVIYLELGKIADEFIVKECYYLDRIRGGKYFAAPQKLTTHKFPQNEILTIIATQLDRIYYGIELVDDLYEMSTDEFIKHKLNELKRGYKFLILVGEGETINGLPSKLTTRLANRIHRKIYLNINYYKDGLGVIESCYYYDRQYKTRTKVMPQMLTTVFVKYNRESILEMVNRELDCDFTDMIIADDTLNIKTNLTAICGNI